MDAPGFGDEEPDCAQGTLDGAPPVPVPVPVPVHSPVATVVAVPRLTGKRLPPFPDSSERPLKRAGGAGEDEEGSTFEAAAAAVMSASPAPALAVSAGLAVDAHEQMQHALAIVMSNPDLAGRVAGGMGFGAVSAVEEASREAATMSSPFNYKHPDHSQFMDLCGGFLMQYLPPVDVCAVRATSRSLRTVANKHGILAFQQVSHTLITDGLCQEYGLDFVHRLLQQDQTLMVHVRDLVKVAVFAADPKILVKVVKSVMGNFVESTALAPFTAWAMMTAWVPRSMKWADFMDPELREGVVREAIDKIDARAFNMTKLHANTMDSLESGTKEKFSPRITDKVLRVLEAYGLIELRSATSADRMACIIVKLMAKFQARGLSLDPEIGALRYIASIPHGDGVIVNPGNPSSAFMPLTLDYLIKTPALPPFLVDVLDIAPKACHGKRNAINDAMRNGNRALVRVLARRSYSAFSNNPNMTRRTMKAAVDRKDCEMVQELVEAGFHVTPYILGCAFAVCKDDVDISSVRNLIGALFSDPRSLHSQCSLKPLLSVVIKYACNENGTYGWTTAVACEVVRALWTRTDADTTLRNLVIANSTFIWLIYKILAAAVWLTASLDMQAAHVPFQNSDGRALDPQMWKHTPGGDPLNTFFAKHATLCFDVRDRLYAIAPPSCGESLVVDSNVRDALVHKCKMHGPSSLQRLALSVPHLHNYLQSMHSFSDDLAMLIDFGGAAEAFEVSGSIPTAKRLLRWCGLLRKFGASESTDVERILQRVSAVTGSPVMPLATVATREVLGAATVALSTFVERETGRYLEGPERLFAEFDGDIGKAISELATDPTCFRNAHPAGHLAQIICYTACISACAEELYDSVVEADLAFTASFITLHRSSAAFMDILMRKNTHVSITSASNTVRSKGKTVWWFGRVREAQ